MNLNDRSRTDPVDLLRGADPVPPRRRAQLAAELDVPAGVSRVLARAEETPVSARAPGRRTALLVAVAVLVAGAGSALGVGLSDYLSRQAAVDEQPWTPPEMKAVGARVEVARGADWSFMAWRSTQGICVAYAAGTADRWARACGFAPGSRPTSQNPSRYLGVLLTAGGEDGASDGLGAIVGAVAPSVARVNLELSDGRTLSARTQKAPSPLEVPVRFFLVRSRLDASHTTPPGPRVTSITSYGPDGTRLERFSTLG
jgi:hypothetical protein